MSDLNRRRFLEDSMFAAAAAVAGGSVSKAFAADEAAPQSTSPNEKIGVAIIGAGGRGGDHVGNFASRQDTEILYICDVDERRGQGRVEEVAKKQGREPKYVQDMRKVFEDPSVDVVSIATPNHWHALAAIWAMQAGKDVYVEKPVSHNVSEGRRMVEAARKYNRICQTGTQSRSNAGMQAMIEYMHGGQDRRSQARPRPVLQAAQLDRSQGRLQDRMPATSITTCGAARPRWSRSPARSSITIGTGSWDYGNGDLGNQGIHQMDIARWGLGVDDIGNGVVSYGGRFGYEDAGETANTQVSIHDYGDKTLVFEVRGLKTEQLQGRQRRRDLLRHRRATWS